MRESGFYTWASLLFLLALLSGCGGKNLILSEASGEPYELVTVYDRFVFSKTPVPDTVLQFFSREIRGLPQSEPMFKVYSVDEQNFSSIFKLHRNVVLITIDNKVKQKGVAVKEDSWARGQLVVQILARSRDEFFEVFRERRKEIESYFVNKEMQRQITEFGKIRSKKASAPFTDSLGVDIVLPDGFYPIITNRHFAVAKHMATKSAAGGYEAKIERGIFVCAFPFTEENIFTVRRMVEVRDSLTRIYFPDYKAGAYMIVEPRLRPDSSAINLNGEFALVSRGLWRIKDGFKGGPFVNLLTYDRKNNRIIMADGYVYAPEFGKRTYIRQVEAIIRSVKPL
jgi:hypothetical protein